MSAVSDLVGDLHMEFDRLTRAGDAGEQRRALRSTLATLYELRCYRKDTARSYYSHADNCYPGRVTEGIILLRGQLTHKVARRYLPEERPLHPSATRFPGRHTYPGANLMWLSPNEMEDQLPDRATDDYRYEFYCYDVAGTPVLETFQIAIDFLLDDAKLGPL
jgi:hypothetical protein